MKNIWLPSFLIPVCIAIVVGVFITIIGEIYLALGEDAIFAALPLMFIIVIVAAVLANRTESDSKA